MPESPIADEGSSEETAFDHAVRSLSKCDNFLLVTHRTDEDRTSSFSISMSDPFSGAFLTEYLKASQARMMDSLVGEWKRIDDDDDGEETDDA